MTRRDWRPVALVAAGGTLGTAVRAVLPLAVPDGAVPWSTLTANLVGAFAIGLLLESLALAASDGEPHRGWRLFLGTGVLGGLTTYSALAVGGAQLAASRPLLAVAYLGGTVLVGLVACACGQGVGRLGVRLVRGRPRDPDPKGAA